MGCESDVGEWESGEESGGGEGMKEVKVGRGGARVEMEGDEGTGEMGG